MTPLGTMMWTASSAGWLVLWWITKIPGAGWTGVACAVMAVIWHVVQQDYDGVDGP